MDPPLVKPGSVARARMLAEQRQQRGIQDGTQLYPPASSNSESPSSPAIRNVKQKGISQYEGGAGKMISRPTPMPQYAAPETPSPTGNAIYPSSYRPPPNRPSQAPQRPPRPSRIPSMVDQARLQEPTPLFIAPVRTAKSPQESTYSQPSPSSQYSSVQYPPNAGYITELPSTSAMNQQKKGAILGPPPSSRRGASSFYSNASFVSPIIEESPQTRSHGSYASSAAMPENWGSIAEKNRNAHADTFYEESITDVGPESIYDEYGDESRLVQPVELDSTPTPILPPSNQERFDANRTPNMPANDRRASWNVLGTARRMSGQPLQEFDDEPDREAIIQAYAAASSGAPADFRMAQSSTTNNHRSSMMNRGLRIDMDAVREAEQRGSLTSLPDLIRRATRLAAMIDKGRRPTSRMDNLNDFLGEKQLNADGRGDTRAGRPPSGLSDMLAAFPPPVSTPQLNNGPNRSSWLGQGGWPLQSGVKGSTEKKNKRKSKRRCCGLPLWAAVLATVLLLCIIVAAIVVPLELFVFNKPSSTSDNSGIEKCRKDLTCLNGGTNVVSRGTCSCICSGGFTGPDCGAAGSVGCTTTDLVSTDKISSIKNVTLGQSLPRLIEEANSNFSVPLSGTSILAKVNASGLSCIAQNSLVTFNGRSSRPISERRATSKIRRISRQSNAELVAQITNEAFGSDAILSNPKLASPETNAAKMQARTNDDQPFNATDTVVDFCRVSVLFVVQEQGVNTAEDAQSDIQAFLTKVGVSDSGNGAKITQKEASNVTLSNGGSINLVDLTIDLGSGLVGGKGSESG
ncbi:hypothetical protein PWT90_04075 [Aphanocladium album]|nr:hypothetical protein PWT90_04075 [Aphanocladium album]